MSIKVSPGPVGTTSSRRRADQVQAVRTKQLARARSAAERWRNGLGALLAIVISLGFVKGRADLELLERPYAYVAALLMIIALASNIVAGYLSLRAAHGFPRLVRLSSDAAQLDRLDSEQLRDTLRDLRGSVRWSLVVMVALPAAMLVIWLAPPKVEAQLVRVRTSAGAFCGSISTSGQGEIAVKENGSKSPTTISLAEARSITTVSKC